MQVIGESESENNVKNPFRKLLSRWRFRRDYFRCSHCGHVFPRKGAELVGWPDHPYGLHVHCPKCDAVVAQYLKKV